jgi:glutathione S-transferase
MDSKKSAQPRYILHYFDCYGRAESTRILLYTHGVDFKDRVFDFGAWKDIKLAESDKFEFGQVPVWEDTHTGETFCQSLSILRMLGKQFGYFSADPREAWLIDSYIDAGKDVQEKFWDTMLADFDDGSGKPREPGAAEKQRKLLDEYINKTCATYLSAIQKRLLKNLEQHPPMAEPTGIASQTRSASKRKSAAGSGGIPLMYLVGNRITLADIETCHIAYTYFMNESGAFYNAHQELLNRPEYA